VEEKGFQLLPIVADGVCDDDNRNKVGFGVSEAGIGARDAMDGLICARETEGGMRCCNVYLEAQRIQHM
jgi:hypothetical protein